MGGCGADTTMDVHGGVLCLVWLLLVGCPCRAHLLWLMSSISFHPSARHNAVGESQYYSADFDTSASFTMNPLSSHPPRAPRNRDAPIAKEIISEVETIESTSEIDEEEDSVKATERKIRREEVWREMVLTSYGRDKTFVREYTLHVLPF